MRSTTKRTHSRTGPGTSTPEPHSSQPRGASPARRDESYPHVLHTRIRSPQRGKSVTTRWRTTARRQVSPRGRVRLKDLSISASNGSITTTRVRNGLTRTPQLVKATMRSKPSTWSREALCFASCHDKPVAKARAPQGHKARRRDTSGPSVETAPVIENADAEVYKGE